MGTLARPGDYDWRTTRFSATPGLGALVQGDPRRVAVNFVAFGAFDFWVWVDSLAAGSAGFHVIPGPYGMTLFAKDWGPLVGAAWYYQGGGGALDAVIVNELFYLAAPGQRGV